MSQKVEKTHNIGMENALPELCRTDRVFKKFNSF
ncbi:hypothetical protein BuS5_03957 (plasmid) [Desulfosarcina sp. BuS5]|nr:hypothetical protein BuS5_03957 [Desulfosarcina sp. BuS5]